MTVASTNNYKFQHIKRTNPWAKGSIAIFVNMLHYNSSIHLFFLIQIIHLFRDSSAFVKGKYSQLQEARRSKEAAMACMCNLSFPLCFSFNPPAPLNLNENPGSDKGRPYNPQQVQGRIREILGKYSNGFWVSKLPQIYRELYKQDLPTESIKDLETWTHICTVCTPYVTVVIYYVTLQHYVTL